MCGGCPAASSVPCGEYFGEFGDAVDFDTAAAGFVVPFGSTEVPFGECDGFGCDDEVFFVSGVRAAHFGVLWVEDDPHAADLGRLVREVETYRDSSVGKCVMVQV